MKKLRQIDLPSLEQVNGGCGGDDLDAEERAYTASLNLSESAHASRYGTGWGRDTDGRASLADRFFDSYYGDGDDYASG